LVNNRFKGSDVFMINFNTTTTRMNELNNQYWSNKKVMERFETNTTTYRELYEENGKIVDELKRLMNINPV
jgi:uncharacterized membrane protein